MESKENTDLKAGADAIDWQASYELHCEMFRHYSSMLFRARILIITVILLVFAFLFGFKNTGLDSAKDLFGLEPAGVVAYLSSIVITLLYSMETAYIRRLHVVAISARRSADGKFSFYFFKEYKQLRHWPLLALYFSAVVFLLLIFLDRVSRVDFLLWKYFSAALSILPLSLLIYTTWFHKKQTEINENK